ncbi:MAG: helix-turn-helix transcriptional regulator [Candidatus Thiodiazotropha lotti]|nr:helix-turn-helix transcriptional regulator [Candidatus Thiodiazotropha lotti]
MTGVNEYTLRIISRIYDGGLSSGHWPAIIDDLTDYFNASGSALFYSDNQNPEINPIITCLSDFWRKQGNLKEYQNNVADDEPSARILRNRKPRDIVTDDALTTEEKQSIIDYGQKMKEIFGLEAMMVARLTETGAWFDYITFQFDGKHGPVRTEEMKNLKILLPHIAKSLEISRPMTVLEQRFNRVLEALDHFHVGVLILTEKNYCLLKNKMALKILEMKDGISLNYGNLLRVTNDLEDKRLRYTVRCVTQTASANGLDDGSVMSITRTSGRDSFLLEVAPLSCDADAFGYGFKGAIVFLIDPVEPGKVSTCGMQELYKLTTSEIEVCKSVVEGYSNQQIADIRNVSSETIKTQIQSLFRKTNTANRSELIRRALFVNLPIDRS